jgi:acetylornithine aminotransferase
MLGMELTAGIAQLPGDASKTQAVRFANLLHAEGLLTIPAGANILRLLPPLILRKAEAQDALETVEGVVARVAG